ncbi:MAG: L,D-transpeptidase family protein [Planctomycetota bacterium]|jgi:lipoprotein-anchoring transpeptidase ErfK/SrfK
MARGQNRFVVVLIVAAVIGLVAYGVFRRPGSDDLPAQPGEPAPGRTAPGPTAGAPPASRPSTPAVTPTTSTAPAPPKPRYEEHVELPLAKAPPSPALRATARARYGRGVALMAGGRLIEARAALADALNSNALPVQQVGDARKRLVELADKTLFSRRVWPKDPCTFTYTFRPGDVLVKVERQHALHVSERLILRVNRIPDAAKIRAGQTVKMIRGPFHAVISKSRFTMDVYLQERGSERMILVRRLPVGIGKDGSTPLGMWRVSLGRKMMYASWTPPPSSNLPPKRIRWGEEGYPLGRMGFWIGLEGIEGNVHTAADGFGIHGTNDPSSIGKAASLGCIRLTDDAIEQVYAMLYPKWSKVKVVK